MPFLLGSAFSRAFVSSGTALEIFTASLCVDASETVSPVDDADVSVSPISDADSISCASSVLLEPGVMTISGSVTS